MASSNGTKPEQYADPLAPTPEQLASLPHDNAGPKLNAIVWSLTAISGAVLGLRIYCRLLRRKGLWWDDVFLIAAWICITVESGLLTAMTTLGYGLHIWDFDLANMQALLVIINVAGTFSVTAAIWSKTSFGITLLHLSDGWVKKATWFILISMNIAMGLSALFPWVNCTPVQKAWNMSVDGTCWKPEVTVRYNIFSGVYSACMDFALAMLPWQFIWGLQMKQKEKIGVGIAMSMGVFAGITGLVKVSTIPKMLSNDFADGIDLWLWGNAETTVTIIAASIPMLRVMIRDKARSQQVYGSSDYHKEQGLSASKPNTRVVTISSGPMSSDVEMVKTSNDDDSDLDMLGGNRPEGIKMGRIMQTNDFSLNYHHAANKK
ncbi:Rhodopsin domain-containing protein [Madurella fahalii]|uniref:Rhodopsin domain-containing protein n=1 Tax=Madurella fahalii TaxID=1157608 RepID=A0ABQ0FWE1_9PEZI